MSDTGFFGREPELDVIARAATAVRDGSFGLVLVAGEAGQGKSALLEQVRRTLGADGWRTVTGRCPEGEGAPPAWPWVEVVRELARTRDPGPFGPELAPLLTDSTGGDEPSGERDVSGSRFRMHRALAGWLASTTTRPLLLVLDDLHRADGETRTALASVAEHLAATPGGAPVLVVAAYRPDEGGDRLTAVLADLARYEPERVRLAGLGEADAAALVRRTSGLEPDVTTLRALAERTAGNPFYLRESARLLAGEGELVALSEVPEGVRDVLRRRFARLPPEALPVLRLAAVIGRDVDVDVLIEAAEEDEDGVLAALEAGVLSGLLAEPGPGTVRFEHVLVPEVLLGDLPGLRRSRWHGRVAQALQQLRPQGWAALAHHLARSASAATAPAAVEASVRAADQATARFSHDSAALLLQQALDCLGRLPGAGPDERFAIYPRLVPALLWSSRTVAAEAVLEAALIEAERADRDDLAVAVLAAADVPLPWLTRRYGGGSPRKARTLRRLLDGGGLDDSTRCRLLCVLVQELNADDRDEVRAEADEALRLARRTGDPARLASALSALLAVMLTESEPAAKGRVASDLLALAREHDLAGAEVIAQQNLMCVAAVEADLAELGRRLELTERAARRASMVQALDTCAMVRAMLEHQAGRLDTAERAYLEVTGRIRAQGGVDADNLAFLSVFTLRLTAGRLAELTAVSEAVHREFGPLVADLHSLVLASGGKVDDARRVYRTGGWPRGDFFEGLQLTVRGMATVAVGAADAADAVRGRLLPFAGRVAGSGTGSFALGPVDQVLGDLELLAGRPDSAAAHYRSALELCSRLEAPLWADRARAGLEQAEAALRR